jgi:hypothetical protein
MTIETKYNVGQKVHILHRNTVREETVHGITIHVSNRNKLDVMYDIRYMQDVNESELFPTKADLLNSL